MRSIRHRLGSAVVAVGKEDQVSLAATFLNAHVMKL